MLTTLWSVHLTHLIRRCYAFNEQVLPDRGSSPHLVKHGVFYLQTANFPGVLFVLVMFMCLMWKFTATIGTRLIPDRSLNTSLLIKRWKQLEELQKKSWIILNLLAKCEQVMLQLETFYLKTTIFSTVFNKFAKWGISEGTLNPTLSCCVYSPFMNIHRFWMPCTSHPLILLPYTNRKNINPTPASRGV